MPGSKPKPVGPRLLAKLRVAPSVMSDGWRACWEWTGTVTGPGGHGRISVNGTFVMAHRVAYELWVGPIPGGMKVCHRCDNPICCNPTHLFLGTQRDNMQDAGRKGRMGTGKHATHCKRGHAFEGNTYIHPVTGRRSCHKCISLRNAARRRHRDRGEVLRDRSPGCSQEALGLSFLPPAAVQTAVSEDLGLLTDGSLALDLSTK